MHKCHPKKPSYSIHVGKRWKLCERGLFMEADGSYEEFHWYFCVQRLQKSLCSPEQDLGRGLSLGKAAAVAIRTCIRCQGPHPRAMVTDCLPAGGDTSEASKEVRSWVCSRIAQSSRTASPQWGRVTVSIWLCVSCNKLCFGVLFRSLFLETATSPSDWISWYLFVCLFVLSHFLSP